MPQTAVTWPPLTIDVFNDRVLVPRLVRRP